MPREPEVANTVEGDVAGQVVQAGVVHGDIVFHAAPNDDVRMVVRHEQPKVELGPGEDARLLLTVSSRSEVPKRLVFDIEGTLGLEWRLVSADYAEIGPVEIVAGRPVPLWLVVYCGATAPMAGLTALTVVATEDRGSWWSSNTQEILIRSRPAVVGALVLSAERVSVAQTYGGVVRLTNTGNTELSGLVKIAPVPEGEPGWLGPAHVGVPDPRFVLSPGGRPVEVPVVLDVPDQPWSDRTLRVPIEVELTRSDVERPVDPLYLHQYGVRADLPLYAAHIADVVRSWAIQRDERTRYVLVAWAVLLVVAGLVAGNLLASPSDASDDVNAAMPSPSSSSAPPSTTAASFTDSMLSSCAADRKVVFLSSLTEEEAQDEALGIVDYETRRLAWAAAEYKDVPKYSIQVGRRDQVCEKSLELHVRDPAKQVFVWIGPLPATEADVVCDLLRKPAWWDCAFVPTK